MTESDKPEATGPLTVDQAVQRWADSQEEQPAETERAEPEAYLPEDVDAEAEEADAGDVTPDDEEPDTEEQLLTLEEYGDVRIANGDKTLTLSEMLEQLNSGTLRREDYTRKTQETAREREALKKREEELATKQAQLDAALLRVNGEEPEPDWEKIFDEDPIEAPRLKMKWEKKQREREKTRAEAQKRQDEELNKFRNWSSQKALEVLPNWAEAGEYEKGEPSRREAAMKIGFTDQEYSARLDTRYDVLLHYAALGMSKEKASAATAKRVTKAPKVLKPGKSRTAQEQKAEQTAARKKILSRPHTIQEHLRAMKG